ncbi:hypothetical protein NPIL_38731 [Nephila pilipes]|uniref:Reverse transcriptase RNase H-like domain-containing protein n=1 Tax=Nephila pilipes TaxID=299642 RepID=A0A8X6P9F7_NEPPI|nr:hypothetical protein NPIL_38731 [Nephila pilipes]
MNSHGNSIDIIKVFHKFINLSQEALGTVIKQEHSDGSQNPISFHSRYLRPYERNYATAEQECLTVANLEVVKKIQDKFEILKKELYRIISEDELEEIKSLLTDVLVIHGLTTLDTGNDDASISFLENAESQTSDPNTKYQIWNPTSRNNPTGNTLLRFSQNYEVHIITLNNPTYYPVNQYYQPSTINIGLTKGLQNITVFTSEDLSSDHYQIEFLVGLDNQILLFNWQKFNQKLSYTMNGNLPIDNLSDLDKAVDNFAFSIQTAINQSSKAKVIEHPYFNILFLTKIKIRSKSRLRKIWGKARYPPLKMKQITERNEKRDLPS